MAGKEDICNFALVSLLGQAPITALDDTSDQNAVLCNHCYDMHRVALLREFPWPFATAGHTLSQSTTDAPDFGYTYGYLIPSTAVRVWHPDDWDIEFEIRRGTASGNILVTDEEEVDVLVTHDVQETGRFDGLFSMALSYRIASSLAMPILRKPTFAKELLQMAEVYVGKARFAAAQENPKVLTQTDTWIAAR